MRAIFWFIIYLVIFSSCNPKKVEITQDYIYCPKRFDEGFTVSLIKVTQYNENGVPENFKDSLRVDLNHSHSGNGQKTIWFRKANEGYFWTKMLRGEYSTMPIEFEEGQWYHIWSNEFETGFFGTDKHSYLIKKVKSRLYVYEKVYSTNL